MTWYSYINLLLKKRSKKWYEILGEKNQCNQNKSVTINFNRFILLIFVSQDLVAFFLEWSDSNRLMRIKQLRNIYILIKHTLVQKRFLESQLVRKAEFYKTMAELNWCRKGEKHFGLHLYISREQLESSCRASLVRCTLGDQACKLLLYNRGVHHPVALHIFLASESFSADITIV